jgi:hypothetical protein
LGRVTQSEGAQEQSLSFEVLGYWKAQGVKHGVFCGLTSLVTGQLKAGPVDQRVRRRVHVA